MDNAGHASSDLRGMAPLAALEEAGLAYIGVHSFKEVVNEDNEASTDVENENSAIRNFARDLTVCDIIVIPQSTVTAWGRFIEDWQAMGKVVVMDIDDDVRYVSPLSPCYKERGTHNVYMRVTGEDKRLPLWVSGETEGFDKERNRVWQQAFLGAIRQADAVTCPTERFAATIREELNPRSYVLPNSLDLDMWKPIGAKRGGFRFGWHGGDSHRMDVAAVAYATGLFLKKHPDATFVLVGVSLGEFVRECPPEQLEFWGWSHYDAHPWRIMALGLDVGLCPVIKHPFNDAKSPLKWTEFGAAGVPSICTNNPPYSDTVRDGVDGWLVEDTAEAWLAALEKAYSDHSERERVAAAARARMEADFDLYKNAGEWYGIYKELIDAKKPLIRLEV